MVHPTPDHQGSMIRGGGVLDGRQFARSQSSPLRALLRGMGGKCRRIFRVRARGCATLESHPYAPVLHRARWAIRRALCLAAVRATRAWPSTPLRDVVHLSTSRGAGTLCALPGRGEAGPVVPAVAT